MVVADGDYIDTTSIVPASLNAVVDTFQTGGLTNATLLLKAIDWVKKGAGGGKYG